MVTYEYHGRIRKKSPQKQIQVFCSFQGAYFSFCLVPSCMVLHMQEWPGKIWRLAGACWKWLSDRRIQVPKMELVLYLFKAVFRGWEDSHIHRPYPLSAYENLHTAAISPSRALLQLEANKTKHLEQHEMLSTRRRMQRNDSLLSTRRTSANFYACCCHLHRTGPNPY